MIDREKVMSWLEGLAQQDWRMFHSDSEVQEIARNALELLKEQEPKKPYRQKGRWFNSYHCGACGEFIGEFGGHRINFCYHCGQAVKWDA